MNINDVGFSPHLYRVLIGLADATFQPQYDEQDVTFNSENFITK